MSHERKLQDDHVAKALFVAMMGDGEDWAAADEATRSNFLELALLAGRSHEELLLDLGFRIAPPGTMLRPKSDNDARAMIIAAQEFLKQPEHAMARRKGLLAKPKLILPSGMH